MFHCKQFVRWYTNVFIITFAYFKSIEGSRKNGQMLQVIALVINFQVLFNTFVFFRFQKTTIFLITAYYFKNFPWQLPYFCMKKKHPYYFAFIDEQSCLKFQFYIRHILIKLTMKITWYNATFLFLYIVFVTLFFNIW